MAATRGGWRMRGIGSAPWWQMCNAVKTGETIGMRMWDVGWASHIRQEGRRQRRPTSARSERRTDCQSGCAGALSLPLHPAGRKARASSSPSGDRDVSGFLRQQRRWWCRRQRRRPPPLHPTMMVELEKASMVGEVTASDAKEEAPFRS
ncbi:hypothetical protein OsI_19043 [Oryza sativa Indica Group]|uniref:Uncharacterized protein n=1 Tax=Oryza sativa subsp. indica TaxID=39946 RepID=B8AZN2_ORYSI|nr:hypothetical protein OsI_19043 [Oryza sativa Indica Group]